MARGTKLSRTLSRIFLTGSFLALTLGAALAEPELQFYPTQAWQVHEHDGQCRVANEFNNGFTIELSAMPESLSAMNINFAQNIFNADQAYQVELTVPGVERSAFNAQATTRGVLSIDMRDRELFYEKIREAAVFDFALEGNEFRFYLSGIGSAASRFERCAELFIAPQAPADISTIENVSAPIALARVPDELEKTVETITPIAATAVAPEEVVEEEPRNLLDETMPEANTLQSPRKAVEQTLQDEAEIPLAEPLPAEEKAEDEIAALNAELKEQARRKAEARRAMELTEKLKQEARRQTITSPAIEIEKEQHTAVVDLTKLGLDAEEHSEPASEAVPVLPSANIVRSTDHMQAVKDTMLAKQLVELKDKVARLEIENQRMATEMKEAAETQTAERMKIASDNWNLELATMKFNEAERQIQRLGRQLQRERAQCEVEKKDLETMLFDPQVTAQEQLAKLADLESQLARAEQSLIDQRVRYEARIQILEDRLNSQ